jgi:hypothetical protein
MAKAERGARTQAIKQYLKEHPKAGPKEVVTTLKAQGMVVSAGLVAGIKYGKRGAKKSRPASRGRSGNRSDAIRSYLTQHPHAKPKEIRTALAKQGVKVGAGLVSNVKHTFFKKRAAPVVRVAARRTSSATVTFEQLLDVKRLADAMGGFGQIRKALEALEQLQ